MGIMKLIAKSNLRNAEKRSLKSGKPVPLRYYESVRFFSQARIPSPVRAPRLAAPEVVRYEYKVEGFRSERAHGVQGRLNRLGKQGWEITTSTHAGSLDFAANRYTVTLRRPLK